MILWYTGADTLTAAVTALTYASFQIVSCWTTQHGLYAYVIRPQTRNLPEGWLEI
jgi:hypothetical protein